VIAPELCCYFVDNVMLPWEHQVGETGSKTRHDVGEGATVMELETGYLLYRLAVVAAGMVSIVLGYRLFLTGVGGEAGGSAASAEAKTRIFHFSIKNAAPGTCFALFGAGLIVAMVIDAQAPLSVQSNSGGDRQVQLKGAGSAAEWKRAKTLAKGGEARASIAVYGALVANPNATVQDVARAAEGMASIYLTQGREKEALAMARLAVQVDGKNPEYLRTLAAVAGANGLASEAEAAASRAER
jgi:hypothetical protein